MLPINFLQSKVAVFSQCVSELITLPADVGFAFLNATGKLARFCLPMTQHEKVNI